MKILLTGGTGFVGSHLVRKLVDLRYEVFLLARANSKFDRIRDISSKVKLIVDLDDCRRILELGGVDVLIHMATDYVRDESTYEEKMRMIESNFVLPSRLLEWCIVGKVKAFINTGTCFEYALSSKAINENSILKPLNYYAALKIAFENIFKYQVDRGLIRGITLKPIYVYGEADNDKVVPKIIINTINNTTYGLSDGRQKLCFTYVGDVVMAYLKAIKFASSISNTKYESFLIGNRKVVTIRKIVAVVEKYLKKKPIVSWGNVIPKDVRFLSCNFSKAKAMLGWEPTTAIEDGLKLTIKSYLKNYD